MLGKYSVLLILCFTLCYSAGISKCYNSGLTAKDMLFSVLNESDKVSSDKIIDDLSSFAKYVPSLLQDCGATKNAQSYKHELPTICIDDLNKGFKLGFKLMGQTQNAAIFAFDLVVFQRLYNKKIRNDCPFLKDIAIGEVKNKTLCIDSSRKFKRYVDLVKSDIDAEDYNKAVDDLIVAIDKFTKTLDDCGQNQLASQIRKDLPVDCLNALNSFGKFLVEAQNNYGKIEWFVNNFKKLTLSFKNVSTTCPIFA